MPDAHSRALELTARYDGELERLVPAGTEIFDAHAHLGTDIDAMVGDPAELLELMDRHGVRRAFVFCLDEPDRHPSFAAANDRTLAYARASEGRLIPFARLDLNESPLEEATRCLDAGARGIKLHPRAQSFDSSDARLDPVFALAAERRVPILIHGGRGLPPIADGLAQLVERHPEAMLIIAHAGIADMAALASAMAGRPQVFFDSSVWGAVDLMDLYRRVPPEQILYASDYPYGQQPASLLIALRTAIRSGYDDAHLRALLAGNANRVADGTPLPQPTEPIGRRTLDQPLEFARIHQYITMAIPLLWTQQPDTIGVLGLALNACDDSGPYAATAAQIAELLEASGAVWATLPEIDDPVAQRSAGRLAFRLLHLADIEAVTAG